MYARVFTYIQVVLHSHIFKCVCPPFEICIFRLNIFFNFLNFIPALPFHLVFQLFSIFISFSMYRTFVFPRVSVPRLILFFSFDFIHFQNNNSHSFLKEAKLLKTKCALFRLVVGCECEARLHQSRRFVSKPSVSSDNECEARG